MSFQISKIVLYGNSGQMRTVPFRMNSVNIITGASKTGKSALIHIVEYCLGRETSGIPAGIILKTTCWFGVHLIRDNDELFITRRNPNIGRLASSEIYVERGHDLAMPGFEDLVPNTSRESLLALLTEYAGIVEYSFDPREGQTRQTGRSDISKALIYCFQKQGEVANQDYLFHRQGEQFLPQSIKDYMPFFLGAVHKDHLLQKESLRRLRMELRRLEYQEVERQRIRGSAFSRAHALIAEAASVGLIPTGEPMPQSWDEVKRVLQLAIGDISEHAIPETQYGYELDYLLGVQKELREKHRSIADEIQALRALRSGGDGFMGEANEQRARLSSIGLIPAHRETGCHVCPLCSSQLDNPVPSIQAIESRLRDIDAQLDGVKTDLPHIQQLIAAAESKQAEVSAELRQVNSQVQAIQRASQQIEDIRDVHAKHALTKGRLGFYLETIADVDDEREDAKAIGALKAQIESLEGAFDADELQGRLDSILSVISKEMTDMARSLSLEYSEHPVRLDHSRLTVVADTENGPISLGQMGSCETWVMLHLITHLVLHRWFARKNLPVPHFVFFDQPTQAYFPPDVIDETVRNNEIESVLRMFRMVADSVEGAGFQVIITEHADFQQDWYQEMVVETWWDGKTKLVPVEWIEDEEKRSS